MKNYRGNRDALWRKANFICGIVCALIGIGIIAFLFIW